VSPRYMSDDLAGSAPDTPPAVTDRALEALLAQWRPGATERIDVERALAQVTARRRADADLGAAVDDLAARRAMRAAAPPAAWKGNALRFAAAMVAVLGATAMWRTIRSGDAQQLFVTERGASKAITLEDGTEVRLGPGSRLTVDAGFATSGRRVALQGEAFFKVTHNAAQPFVIRVGNTRVEDLGTAFLVRESPSREVSVRVTEGAVRITAPVQTSMAKRDSTVMLHAGDGATSTRSGIAVATGAVSTSEGIALAAGRLTFTESSLREVSDALQRWYGVTLVLGDTALANRHVTADLTGEPIARVAAVLGLTLGVDGRVLGDTIELRGAPRVLSRP
jgi:ferric-dicitrate binding protein FerR (iron transport regulator)